MGIIRKVENFAMIILFLLGVLVNLIGVFFRYFTNTSQFWTTEAYTLLLLTAVFIGFGTALRDNVHISIDILYDKFNEKWKIIIDFFTIFIGTIFSLFFIVKGLQLTITAFNQGITTPDIGIDVWITYLILPIAGGLLLIHFIEKGYGLISKLKSKGDEE
ncbi:TRAP transporter small permease [Virgibacillus sp. C22-A2]|uniref:TRAP transporter small permease n=1 Tax=Virgibacillus tibetensis TaxID=3042313 RepID=A0ABU6KFX5_9BACI|nr:TRAP transporter small permease [Virgibacillus sp. C22-A2]